MNQPLATPHLPGTVEGVQFRLRLPSQPDWIEPTVDYLRQQALACGGILESQSRKVMMVLHEALSNSLVHGNLEISSDLKNHSDNAFAEALAQRSADPAYSSRMVDLTFDYDGERSRWTVTDEGRGFDVQEVLQRDPLDEDGMLRPSGRGILIMRSFLDDVAYELGGRRIILTLRKITEERRQPRSNVRKPIQVMPIQSDGTIDWDAAYQAVSRNLSHDGIAILQSRLTPAGRILLALPGEGQPVYVPAEVCHFRPVGDNLMELGCRFQTKPEPGLSSAQIATNSGAAAAIDNTLEQVRKDELTRHEKRLHARFSFTEKIRILSKDGTELGVGFARDLSKGGIALVTPMPLPQATYVFSLPQGDQPAVPVEAKVVRCVKIMEGFYDVGACFNAVEE